MMFGGIAKASEKIFVAGNSFSGFVASLLLAEKHKVTLIPTEDLKTPGKNGSLMLPTELIRQAQEQGLFKNIPSQEIPHKTFFIGKDGTQELKESSTTCLAWNRIYSELFRKIHDNENIFREKGIVSFIPKPAQRRVYVQTSSSLSSPWIIGADRFMSTIILPGNSLEIKGLIWQGEIMDIDLINSTLFNESTSYIFSNCELHFFCTPASDSKEMQLHWTMQESYRIPIGPSLMDNASDPSIPTQKQLEQLHEKIEVLPEEIINVIKKSKTIKISNDYAFSSTNFQNVTCLFNSATVFLPGTSLGASAGLRNSLALVKEMQLGNKEEKTNNYVPPIRFTNYEKGPIFVNKKDGINELSEAFERAEISDSKKSSLRS